MPDPGEELLAKLKANDVKHEDLGTHYVSEMSKTCPKCNGIVSIRSSIDTETADKQRSPQAVRATEDSVALDSLLEEYAEEHGEGLCS